MSSTFDYCIVGGGPSGLTTALLLAERGYSICLIESETLGGCHRVRRGVDDSFSEHGPRVYSSAFVTFIDVLNRISKHLDGAKSTFYDLFVPYNFGISTLVLPAGHTRSIFRVFTISEWIALMSIWALPAISSKHISVGEFCIRNRFSRASIDYINRLCLLTDGADADKYSLFKFVQLANQQALHGLYQPAVANDKGLFYYWEFALRALGVVIHTNTQCLDVKQAAPASILVSTSHGPIQALNVVLCVPPLTLVRLITPTRQLVKWAMANSYRDYYSICFQWKIPLQLKKIHGFPYTQHGVAFIVLSDYIDTDLETYKTIISCALTLNLSDFAKQPDASIIETCWNELRETFDLPPPDVAAIGSRPGQDYAYIQSTEDPSPLSANLEGITGIKGLYTVGTHNGHNTYSFTSMESACQNAYAFVGEKIKTSITLNNIATWLILLLFIVILCIAIMRAHSFT